MKRIHIVGASPRTGTTLMAEAMIACFNIDLYIDHENRISAKPPRGGNIFLTKDPQDIVIARPLLKIWPDLYIIYMIRDPRDIITSKHPKDPDRYWTHLKFWKICTPYGRKLKDHPHFITIRYEDLVRDPDGTQGLLIERMPFLVKEAAFSRFHEVSAPSPGSVLALRKVRPISSASAGRWQNHLPRVVGQLLQHGPITKELIEFGYETDDSWLEELEGLIRTSEEVIGPNITLRHTFCNGSSETTWKS